VLSFAVAVGVNGEQGIFNITMAADVQKAARLIEEAMQY
jgi:hypothetical protein